MRKLTKFKQAAAYTTSLDTAGLYLVVYMLGSRGYVFDPTFIHLIRYALTTSYTTEMSVRQSELFLAYIDAVNGVIPFTAITSSLDKTLVNLALCVDDGTTAVWGDSSNFTYAPCGVDINL